MSRTSTVKAIPPSVRNLLVEEWRKSDQYDLVLEVRGGYANPSAYSYRKKDHLSDYVIFKYEEVAKLMADDVAPGLIVKVGDEIVVNEFVQLALLDMLSDMYSGWEKFVGRVQTIQRNTQQRID